MVRTAKRFVRERPLAAPCLAAAMLAAAVLTAAAGVEALRFATFLTELPAQGATATAGASSARTYGFRFLGCTRFVRVEVRKSELEASRRLATGHVFASVPPVRAAYMRALVRHEAASPAVAETVQQLRLLRGELGLDDDQYAELIVRFVQSIPYGAIDSRVRPAAQVLAEGVAACDDRSVLLAALLLHEGYDTAVIAFDSQSHAAVGIRTSTGGYRGSGYAFVETNHVAFIGESARSYASGDKWRRAPQIVRVGGRRVYSAEREAAYVASVLRRATFLARRLEPYSSLEVTGPERWRRAYAEQSLRRSRAQQTVAIIRAHDYDRKRLFRVLAEGQVDL